ncbi:MAG: restriction endonuclease subunit S [Vicinamibacterales bacterium]
MSFPKHANYRASGVEWLGAVPDHWQVLPVKHVATVVNGYPFDSALFDLTEGYPLVRIRDLNRTDTEALFKGPFVERASITSDDVLIGMDGDFNVGRWRGTGKALLNQRMCCVRGNTAILTRLLEYTLPIPLKAINDVTYSTTVKHLASSQVEKTLVAIPPDPLEQSAIADFLDRETSALDGLVAEQERLIELLTEKQHSIILHAVTKGLNADAPMKPSGIEWLGDVPSHWEVKRLKRLSPAMTVGIVVNPSTFVSDDGLPFIYGGDIREGVIDWVNARRISPHDSATNAKTQLHSGDLLMVRVGAPGVTAVVPEECEGGNCASVMLIRQGAFNSEWLCFVANTRIVRFQVEIVQYGAAQEQFNIGHAVNFWVPVPPRTEQDELSEFLRRETSALDCLIAEATRAIGLLQERRTALISAAVTGQIDVSGMAGQEALA